MTPALLESQYGKPNNYPGKSTTRVTSSSLTEEQRGGLDRIAPCMGKT